MTKQFVEVEEVIFSAAHFIIGNGKELCENLHGHNYSVDVRIYGNNNENSMIIDFRILKQIVKDVCSRLDHKFLLPDKSKFVETQENDKSINIVVYEKEYTFPREDVLSLPIFNSTVEELSKLVFDEIRAKLATIGFVEGELRILVEEIPGQRASYFNKL